MVDLCTRGRNRIATIIAAFLLGTTALAGRAAAADLTVSLQGGPLGEAIKTTLVKPFREESKLDVVSDDRDWGIGAVRAKVEGGGNTWDVVNAEDIEVIQGCDEGIFAHLDTAKISSFDKFVIKNEDRPCGLPSVIYNTSLAYNNAKMTTKPTSWADFWDTKTWPGRRSMVKSPQDVLEIALMADGVPRDDVYKVLATPAGVDRAFKKLDELKPNIIWWTNPGQSRQLLASGETVMSATYDNGIYFFNRTQKTDFGTTRKDAITHTDYWAVLAGSKHEAIAYKFLNYASDAKPAAVLSDALAISVPNSEAVALVPAELRPNLSALPSNMAQAVRSDAQFWVNHYDALSKRFDAWAAQ
ncbi:ABC transporter substrate-binding protein [Lichenifustis flavocetrariae]|uniref:ABC transporter substrate-binding protein n=1 Tax=Lichenifustis flavocetrariae TaxID=2949735 RepID=A0AA41YVQ2_9HYPH|nr:ABC transporter substrate-binding protein [Lichenifustis flavocetrariae]MCW6507813.1 ABC transporter substrate-binding protein [Lichenifustis flavocetrariae]